MGWPLAIGAVAGLGSAAVGAAQGAAGRADAQKLIDQTIRDYEAMGIPSIEAQKIALEELKSAGKLTPEMEQQVLQGESNYGDIALDPAYKDAQMSALDELQELGSGGGVRLSDQASMEEIMSGARQQERGSREAILADSRMRGTSGGGSELAAQLANQQSSAQTAHMGGLQVAGQAQDRALEAIMQGGQLAGSIRGQDYGEQSEAASARDKIANFNAMNQSDTQQRNVDRGNSAQQYNLANDQRISDSNVGTRNQEQQFNKGLQQSQFDNQLSLNQAKGNARANQASGIQSAAAGTQAAWAGVGQGAAQIGAQASQSQQQGKQNNDYMKFLDEDSRRKYGA